MPLTLSYPFILPRALLSVALAFTVANTTAQTPVFIPDEENETFFTSLSAKYQQIYKTELSTLPSLYKKDHEKIYEKRWKHINEKFENKEIYADKEAQQYLDELVAEIIKANPPLKSQSFRCYFSRSGVPNASYIGHGIILFNMGLFQRLNNESEAAFILSHEIAHFLLKHSEKAMNRYVTAINSEEMQNSLRQIKNTEYGKRAQLEKLVNSVTFNSRRHSRDHESDADSLAVELMRNTRFDLNAATATLSILDHVDKDTINIAAALEKTFNSTEYPFRKKWLKKEEGLLGGHAVIKEDSVLADSLKTHPDCKLRVASLSPMIEKYQSQKNSLKAENSPLFAKLQRKFRYEIIHYSFNNSYSRSLYYTVQLLQDHPTDPFLVAHTGKIFNELYTARKEHTLGKKTDLPAPFFGASYNTLLQFLQNLYAEDFAAIGYHFLKPYNSQLSSYAFYNKTFETSSRLVKQ